MTVNYYLIILLLLLAACNAPTDHKSLGTDKSSAPVVLMSFAGDYDNFLQHWKQNTETAMHQDNSGKHEHVHIKISHVADDAVIFEFFGGRNNETRIGEKEINIAADAPEQDANSTILQSIRQPFVNADGSFKMNGDTLWTDGMGILPKTKTPYRLIRCRYFAGWIDIPHPSIADSTYRTGNLKIHDQGGMAQLDFPGIEYTAELTQLEFAHTIKIMKLAIYDMPMTEVGINSRSISYTWSSPETKRLGINLRKVISGWTFIEEGYINSENLKKK